MKSSKNSESAVETLGLISPENKARLRLKKRMEVAFKRKDLELIWEVPDDWAWFLDDPSTHTRCKKMLSEEEVVRQVAGFCPRVIMGEIPECLHTREALELHRNDWGLAIFLTQAPPGTDLYPIPFTEHWHPVRERLFVVAGQGCIVVDGEAHKMYSQDIIDIPAGAIHSGRIEHPARIVAAFQTWDGRKSYGVE